LVLRGTSVGEQSFFRNSTWPRHETGRSNPFLGAWLSQGLAFRSPVRPDQHFHPQRAAHQGRCPRARLRHHPRPLPFRRAPRRRPQRRRRARRDRMAPFGTFWHFLAPPLGARRGLDLCTARLSSSPAQPTLAGRSGRRGTPPSDCSGNSGQPELINSGNRHANSPSTQLLKWKFTDCPSRACGALPRRRYGNNMSKNHAPARPSGGAEAKTPVEHASEKRTQKEPLHDPQNVQNSLGFRRFSRVFPACQLLSKKVAPETQTSNPFGS